jgi:hypothetical protein
MRYLLVLCLLLGGQASARDSDRFRDSWRCGNGIVEVGMHRNDVMDECGRQWVPDEIRTKVRYYQSRDEIIHFVESLPPAANTYQFWIYREYGQYETWIWFKNGFVTRIEYGDRV